MLPCKQVQLSFKKYFRQPWLFNHAIANSFGKTAKPFWRTLTQRQHVCVLEHIKGSEKWPGKPDEDIFLQVQHK